jgi:light-regulated signal transduction histidine kinase (bacteriophytochrome)
VAQNHRFDNTYREKIFEAFERLYTDEFAGTGLGLATARRSYAGKASIYGPSVNRMKARRSGSLL